MKKAIFNIIVFLLTRFLYISLNQFLKDVEV